MTVSGTLADRSCGMLLLPAAADSAEFSLFSLSMVEVEEGAVRRSGRFIKKLQSRHISPPPPLLTLLVLLVLMLLMLLVLGPAVPCAENVGGGGGGFTWLAGISVGVYGEVVVAAPTAAGSALGGSVYERWARVARTW